jgi:NADH:ubiquinone oxidoreductase subunit
MDRQARLGYTKRMNIGTRIFTWLNGKQVGRDGAGNVYFEEKRPRGPRTRRWVAYAGIADASSVPPEWHAWLHYTTEAPLSDATRRPWQKPFEPNLTGTPAGYRPPGHDYEGGKRARASGDYEAWTPGS